MDKNEYVEALISNYKQAVRKEKASTQKYRELYEKWVQTENEKLGEEVDKACREMEELEKEVNLLAKLTLNEILAGV